MVKCDCGKRACFNFRGEKAKYCRTCMKPNMVDVVHPMCGCGKRANSNYPHEKKAIYCAKCRQPGMIDILTKRCRCRKTLNPCYNFPMSKTGICCHSCRENGMINIRHKRCKCGNRSTFNFPGKSPLFCKICRISGMIDVANRKCICGKKQPNFNFATEISGICCDDCRSPGMINVTRRRCKCNKTAMFNFDGLKPQFCFDCKEVGMVDVNHKKCENISCEKRSNSKYKNFCSECYALFFPNDELTHLIQRNSKELIVAKFLDDNFSGFIHNKTLGRCKRRIDHRLHFENTLLAVETDEFQHKYSTNKIDEEKRYNDIKHEFSGNIIFIRYNPDKYRDLNGILKNPSESERHCHLLFEIHKQKSRIRNGLNDTFEIVKLFYDSITPI